MAPRTRASSKSKHRPVSKKVASKRREETRRGEEEEFKAESPASDNVLEHQERQNQKSEKDQRPQRFPSRSTPDSDDVLSGDYLLKAGRNTSALSKRLKQMWETLQHTASRQQQREEATLTVSTLEKLDLVTAELLQPQLMKHPDQNVRSLVACCLVEIMRVSTPQSPFRSEEELYRVFKLLVEQIRSLGSDQGTASSDLQRFYVLESLATVKSCVLVVGLEFTMEENEDVMIVQLFQALFDTIKSEHPAKIETLMLSIMIACIEELGGLDTSLLDVILSTLMDETTSDDMNGTNGDNNELKSASNMARKLLQRTSDLVQDSLSTFFNTILAGNADTVNFHKNSQLKEHVYALLYKVHLINPSLLLYVFPNVCHQLQVDEVATRSDAIALLGKLFASPEADYGHHYMKNFRDFLGRFRDASKDIRMQMIRVCVPIWEHKMELRNLLEHEFILRLSDPEWEIRQLVVHELCDFAANNLELISEECLRAVGERMKDKKVLLRKETMTGLSQVFLTHVSTYWEEEENRDETSPLSLHYRNLPASNLKKLGWIPDYVLKCYAYPQQELQLRVIHLLDDFLLPKAFSERLRTNGLLFIFHSLDATSKEALRRIFSDRAKCQTVIQQFVNVRLQQRSKRCTIDANRALEKAKQQLYQGLAPLFSDVSGLNKLLEKLVQWKDRRVFKHLSGLCDFSKSQSDIRHEREELIRCVGSKTPLGELLKNVCRKLSLLTINQASVAVLLDSLILKEGRPSRETRSIVELVVLASGEQPELFAPFIQEKISAILIPSNNESPSESQSTMSDVEDEEHVEEKDPRVILGALNVLANYSQRCVAITTGSGELENGRTLSTALIKQLHTFCLGDSSVKTYKFTAAMETRAAELAALALSYCEGNTAETKKLIELLCSKKQLGSLKYLHVAVVLQSLKVFSKRCGHIFMENKPLFQRLWRHLYTDLIGKRANPKAKEGNQKSNRPAAIKVAEKRCVAIQVAVNLIVYSQHLKQSFPVLNEGLELVHLLFDIIRSDGRMYASTPSLTALFRSSASCGLLKLVRNRQLEASLSVSEWHLLGFMLQDPNDDVRRLFLKKLTALLLTQSIQHPHKYLSYLALAATDSNTSVKKMARNLLKLGVDRMRRLFDAAASRESELNTKETSQTSPSLSALMVPEYALLYVIHLLAHHPVFPVKLVDRTPSSMIFQSPLWTDQLAYLGFFLDGLVGESTGAAGNIAFLLQMLTKLSQCHDVTSPEDINIYPLIDSAVVLLKRKIKNQSNLQPFPGKIFLPKHLYSPGRPETLATPGGRKEPEGPDSLKTSQGSRLGASLSPIKPMDFTTHFMKLNSPPGSSLSKSYAKKRKRSLLKSDEGLLETEEKAEDNEDEDADVPEALATLAQC